jgi:Tfp pilus assembly protein PilF
MTNRHFLTITAALFIVLSVAARENRGGSWVGKKIIPTKSQVSLHFTGSDGRDADTPLDQSVHTVLADQGGKVKVRQRGIDGWVEKDDVVLVEQAPAYFSERLRKDPNDVVAYMKRALAWRELGKWDDAIGDYTAAMQLQPNLAYLYSSRAGVYAEKGDYDRAIEDYTQNIRLRPKHDAAFDSRGNIYQAKKQYDRALEDYNQAIRLNPKNFRAFNNRGVAYASTRQYERAVEDYQASLRLDPKYAEGYNNLAWLWATCPVPKFRDKRAVEYATKACDLTDWKASYMLDTLACAYAEVGQFQEAEKWAKKAVLLTKPSSKESKSMKTRLKLFEQGKPYRDEEQ